MYAAARQSEPSAAHARLQAEPTVLQLGREAKATLLVGGVLCDGIAKEQNLVVWRLQWLVFGRLVRVSALTHHDDLATWMKILYKRDAKDAIARSKTAL